MNSFWHAQKQYYRVWPISQNSRLKVCKCALENCSFPNIVRSSDVNIEPNELTLDTKYKLKIAGCKFPLLNNEYMTSKLFQNVYLATPIALWATPSLAMAYFEVAFK